MDLSKSAKLRGLFTKPGLIRLVGAHNGLTAKLIEQAGFEGVWASSLEVSASHAVPDANILTMTDYLNAAISMNDAIAIPVVVDVDQGYGNSTNVIHMVKKFEAAGIAGIIMEDKLFPKQNSLLADGRQELASIAEFVGKIMAAKNAQKTKDFMVFARVEALIAGWGQEEAMKRAKAYIKAGADGIMIHSKKNVPDEVLEFINNWDRDVPIVLVPTKYPSLTEDELKKYPKVKMVIYANHVIRSAVTSIKNTLKEIHTEKGIHTVTPKLVPVTELFTLQGTHEMKENEKKFLKTGKESVTAVIPAAGKHNEETLKPLLKDMPRCMLDIHGKPILQRIVETLNRVGINNIYTVTGYNADKINIDKIKKITAEDYEKNGIVGSIMSAENYMEGKTLILYSDILFEDEIVEKLIKMEDDVVLVIDSAYKDIKDKEKPLLDRVKDNEILKIGCDVPKEEANYEFIGMMMLSGKGVELFKKAYYELKTLGGIKDNDVPAIIQYLISKGIKVKGLEIYKGWAEIQTFDDYKKISSQLA